MIFLVAEEVGDKVFSSARIFFFADQEKQFIFYMARKLTYLFFLTNSKPYFIDVSTN